LLQKLKKRLESNWKVNKQERQITSRQMKEVAQAKKHEIVIQKGEAETRGKIMVPTSPGNPSSFFALFYI